MNLDGFRTDNETLTRRAETLGDLSDRATRIVSTLRDELGAHGACWGADEPGQVFAASHANAADTAFTGIEQLPAGITDVAERLVATAVTYEGSETESDRVVRDAGRDLI